MPFYSDDSCTIDHVDGSSGPTQLNTVSNTYHRTGMDCSPNRMLDFGTNLPSDDQALKRYVAHNPP